LSGSEKKFSIEKLLMDGFSMSFNRWYRMVHFTCDQINQARSWPLAAFRYLIKIFNVPLHREIVGMKGVTRNTCYEVAIRSGDSCFVHAFIERFEHNDVNA